MNSNPKSPQQVLFKSIKKKVFDTVSKKFNLTDKNFKPRAIADAIREDKLKFD